MNILLATLFCCVATLYSSVGLGGGSTYIALMLLWNTPMKIVPIVALVCNLSVVSINLLRYERTSFPFTTLFPLIGASIPMAYLGGMTPIDPTYLKLLLGLVLLCSGIAMLYTPTSDNDHNRSLHWIQSVCIGSILGGLAGLVGIGGGIFLIPILYYYRIGSPTRIAQLASGFIFCNSIAGLLGQLHKVDVQMVSDFGGLNLAVIIGALLGTKLHLTTLKPRQLRWVSILLIELVAIRMLVNTILSVL